MKPSKPAGGLVYSTDLGRTCPECRQAIAQCRCKAAAPPPQGDGIVRVSRETSGRKGKGVTVVRGLTLDAAALASLGKSLRTACGTGGTTKDGVIELQGDHRDAVVERLAKDGWPVKRAGG